MPSYLYGLSVSNIQEFIFSTGKLKEIIGASEFVEQACGKLFTDEVAEGNDGDFKKENLIIAAAGKVAYRFEEEAQCRRIVRNYVASLKQMMPDLRVAQACIKLDGQSLSDSIAQLNHQLEINQSLAIPPFDLGLMISRRSRRTGVPATKFDPTDQSRKRVLDRQQVTKREFAKESEITAKFADSSVQFPVDINQIAEEGQWLAVVHADGNGLGKVVQDIYHKIDQDDANTGDLQRFSDLLNECTQKAVSLAFEDVVRSRTSGDSDGVIPFRPLILGGDDLSVIIRGDLALDFTTTYLRHFEQQTKDRLSSVGLGTGLTACAGIAYIKPNYPIHYGMELAEELTKAAKTTAKGIAAPSGTRASSCLLFHKVQSSYVEGYDEIIDRVLTAGPVRFNYGPYFLHKPASTNYPDVQQLTSWVREVKRKDAPRSSLRNWLSVLERGSKPEADQLMVRIQGQHPRYLNKLNLTEQDLYQTKGDFDYTHLYDVLTLASVQ
jgi:hypothetical protein